MKYLIVGLGNMGPEYDNTRHNVGFEVIDRLAKEFEVEFEHEHLGDLGTFRHKGRTIILLKPSTYMNRSGKAVRYWMLKKKIQRKNLLVIVDDVNLLLGAQRIKGKGSDGGHNGLRDIDQMTGGNNYARLRIGIGSDFPKGRQADYVLGEWSTKELEQLPEIVNFAAQAIKSYCTVGLNHTMNQYNRQSTGQ